jgi:hypothetical protein
MNNKPNIVASAIAALAFITPIVALFWGTYSVYCNDWATSFLMFAVFLYGVLLIGISSYFSDRF